jgi:hypothetical protein
MSIESLKQDFATIVMTSAPRATPERPVEAADIAAFLNNNLLPWLENATEELGGIDEVVEDLVHQTPDVLHTENAELFAGLIVAGRVLMAELKARIGTDQRVGNLIKEWNALANEAMTVIDEILIPDEEDDEDEPDGTPEAAPSTPAAGGGE